ncbi:MAG TPA: hypothetical protein VEY10_15580 [Flavisolibacter sp.]|nr:hypothetical protein [Flavisolibacter sp.]
MSNRRISMLPFLSNSPLNNFLNLLWINGLLFCCFLLLSPALRSQTVVLSSQASLAEKIYVQPDNLVYTTDQTIWFKAILTNAAYHTPTKISGVLYVELIDPHENIAEKKRIKIDQGVGHGFFQLAPTYTHGVYQIRAYTEWNKNFGQGFVYKEYVLVSGPEGKQEPNPIRYVKLIEGQPNERRLQVTLDPAAIDSLGGKAIAISLLLDKDKNTIPIKKNKSSHYVLDYIVPSTCRTVTIQMEGNHHVNHSKTIVLDTSRLDVQFLPESGELVQGLTCLLGCKVLGFDGKGRQVRGEVVNSKGFVITSFKTNQLGMGSVWLNTVDSNEQYTARILLPTGNTLMQIFPLPPIAPKGTILSVRKDRENIRFAVSSSSLVNDSIMIRASCRGIINFDFKGRLKNGHFDYWLPAHELPEGIISFTLMADGQTPLAERLYFNEQPQTRLSVVAASDKKTYTQREKVQLLIETKDGMGQSVPANVSILAFNKSQQGSTLNLRQNILSHFLLSSDLKGEIENPGFYFSNENEKFNDLDALLLTQGWRKYNYARDTISFRFQPEPYLAVKGHVKGGLSDKKIIRGADLTMMTFGERPSFANQKTDSMGRFTFWLNDQYGQDVSILIQSASKAGKQRNYLITLDKKEIPPVSFDHLKSVQKPDSILQAYITQRLIHKKAEDAYKAATEGITLQEVVIKSRILSAQQKLVEEKYGRADVIIDGKAIRNKEEKWSYGLYSVLLFSFPDQVKIIRRADGNLYARLHNSEMTLVVIDGIPVKAYDYALIPGIPPSEVKSFELIDYAKNFSSLFCEALPEACGASVPTVGNVIAIYTYAGKGLDGVKPTVGLKQMTVPVFSSTREFYAPKYDALKPEDWLRPDRRNLVYWASNLKTDSTGQSFISFYNSDNTGAFQVVVEAISENGEIGYQELFFDVKKKE